MLKKIGFAIIAVLVVIGGLAAMQPSEFTITRSATINAAPALVFPMINNLKNWPQWSPYAEMDPNMKATFEGPDEGEGAIHAWDGEKIGQGKMTITKSTPAEKVEMVLEFKKPMEATNTALFTFVPEGTATNVTWSMSGKNSFMGKVFGLFMNIEKMVGSDFEKGLANIKSKLEAATPAAPADAAAPAATETK
ncbi:MAG: SRPBCC family protein [Bdellovibrionales bacterium]|nr:SRPBCC family protein [Bdellovibrionales bacterium]